HTGQQKQTITQLTSRIIHPIIIPKTQQPPAEPKSPLAAADEQASRPSPRTRQCQKHRSGGFSRHMHDGET
ncbi:hypothetical protein, partial [Methylobacterium sp. W2]|uniref:hypothetical protein n=1 Tax=Methylobacterium sp. W2 TaxID=2598107 RepID=UPI001D0C7671